MLNCFMFQVEDGTAKVGKDFTHSSASLIQFDPGQLDFILDTIFFMLMFNLFNAIFFFYRSHCQILEYSPQR